MRLYTRAGDRGRTQIIGGQQVSKDSLKVQAYGHLDELNSLIGIVRSLVDDQQIKENLLEIQHELFDGGYDLALPEGNQNYRLDITSVKRLEEQIDDYVIAPPAINNFILPGGNQLANHCHLARAVTRRAERAIVAYFQQQDGNQIVLQYINRLSDYFFALARYVNHCAGVEDILYRN